MLSLLSHSVNYQKSFDNYRPYRHKEFVYKRQCIVFPIALIALIAFLSHSYRQASIALIALIVILSCSLNQALSLENLKGTVSPKMTPTLFA